MRPPKTRARYIVCIPLPAVKLEDRPGSTLRDPTTTLVEIPAGTVLETEGAASHSGLINVIWNSDAYSVFHEDLHEKARLITTAEAAG